MLLFTTFLIFSHHWAFIFFGLFSDASQEPPKLANGPITRNMAKRIQARLNLWAQREVTRRIQEQASMLMEEELKESTKFINLLEVIMENGVGEAKFEIHTRPL